MVDLYSGPPVGSAALTEQGTYAVPSTTGEVLGAAFGEGLAANLTPRIFRAASRSAAETGAMIPTEGGYDVMAPPETPMDTDAVNSEFAIPGHLKFDKPTPRSVAQDLYEAKRDQILRQDIIDRREGGILTGAVARFGANIAAGAPDPLNLAVGMIPVAGEARIAALLAGAGSAVGRAGIRAGIGGAQGAVGMAALQPLEFAISKSEREDYTMADALRSIAVGTVLGGGLHATIGGAIDRVTGKYRNPVSQALEESGPEARQALLHRTLAQTIDGRPVSLEADLPLVDALRAREVARMTVRQGGRDIDQALPGAFEDPLVLARRGELTADRAAQIRDDLAGLSATDIARAKARIGEHVDPEMWKVIADNLAKAEGSREGAIAVVADQLRYLPASGAIRTASEREAAAVIGRAMQAEAARGGDVGSLVDTAMQARHAGGAMPATAAAQKQQLLDMHAQGAEALAARTPLVGGSIASDVAAAFVAAGRTEAEAADYGRFWQAVAERRAQAFRGLRGTAEDMYREMKPDIMAGEAGGELLPGELGQAPSETKGHPEGNAEDAAWRRLEPEKTAGGDYRGAPDDVKSPRQLGRLRRLIRQLIDEGVPGRFWYEDSARRIVQITRGNLSEAEKLIGLVAIYSPQTRVFTNMTFAIHAFEQWKRGEPINVKTGSQDSRAAAWLERGEDWGGRKTNNFYLNLMHEIVTEHPESIKDLNIPPDVLTAIKGATVDLWVLRALGYKVDAAGGIGAGAGNKYGFSEREIQRAAGMLNKDLPEGARRWLPHQVQAALWSAIKARYELPSVKEATWVDSEKAGYAKRNEETGRLEAPGESGPARAGHMEIWRKHALAASPEDVARAVETAKGSFGDAIDRVAQNVTWEAIPSSALGHEINNASPEAKGRFTREALSLITDDDGNDVLAAQLGVNLGFNRTGTGAYAGDLNPNVVTTLVPEKPAGFFDAVKARQYARAIQHIFRQDAVPFFRAESAADFSSDYSVRNAAGRVIRNFPTQGEAQVFAGQRAAAGNPSTVTGGKLARGIHLEFAQDLDEAAQRRLLTALQEELGADAGFTKTGDRDVVVINYRGEDGLPFVDDVRFLDAVERVAARDDINVSKVSKFGSEGEYGPVHDWQAEPVGPDPGLAGGSPAFQSWVRDRTEAFQRLLDDWRDPESRIAAEPRQGAEPGAATEPGATAEPGAGPSPRGPPGELEQAGRAKVRLATDDQRALLTLFRDADATSIGHESWHIFTNELFDDALHPDAPPELIADAAALRKAVGAEEGVPLTREQQEQLAGWGEQYLREGRAPVPELQGIFDRFRAWFLNIYETIAGLGAPINDEVRGIYDRMISLDGRPPESGGGVRTPASEGSPFERARAAGEPGGPRSSDTIAQINAQAEQLERMKRPGEARPEAQAETLAATEAAAEADARASAHEQAAYCIARG